MLTQQKSTNIEAPRNCRARRRKADVAQLVEQRIRNAKVVSSIPIIGTNAFLNVRGTFKKALAQI
jgi:hypothetical protein